MLRINCEAAMWKITTRGFTLEEVLIMAAMNLLASAPTAPKRQKRVSQKSPARPFSVRGAVFGGETHPLGSQ